MSEIAGRYVPERLLGKGGMGSVYLAWDKKTDKRLALKLIRAELCEDPKMRRRFVRESKVLSYLKHPHIVEVYGFGQTDEGQLFMTMEYIDSFSLRDLKDVKLPLSMIKDLILQLLDALSHAHVRGIIHHDLKPANILLVPMKRGEFFLKLVDFGIASLPSFSVFNEDATKSIMGTPAYMAPEQARGVADAVGPGSDLYSVGVMLYEMISGDVPFKGAVDIDTILMHLEDPVPPLTYREGYPVVEGLDALIKKSMEKKVYDRFLGVTDFREALLKLNFESSNDARDFAELYCFISDHLRDSSSDSWQPPLAGNFFSESDIHAETSSLGSSTLGEKVRGNMNPSVRVDGPSYSLQSSSIHFNSEKFFDDQIPFQFFASNFRGREEEVSIVRTALEQMIQGEGSCLFLSGEWGIGKSSIVKAALSDFESSKTINIVSMLPEASDVTSDSAYMVRRALDAVLGSTNVNKMALPSFYTYTYRNEFPLRLDGVEISNFVRPELGTAPVIRPNLLIKLIDLASKIKPLILIVEDMHFLNEYETQFVSSLVSAMATSRFRLLLICLYNPYEAILRRHVIDCIRRLSRYETWCLTTIKIDALLPQAFFEISERDYHLDKRVSGSVYTYSRGNPWVATHYLQKLMEENLLQKDFSVNRLRFKEGEVVRTMTPTVISNLMQSYYGRLRNAMAQHVNIKDMDEIMLRMSIIGNVIPDALLEDYFSLFKEPLSEALDEAVEFGIRNGFIEEISINHKPGIRCRVGMLMDYIANTRSNRVVRNYHANAIKAKLRYYGDCMGLEEYLEMANHYEKVGDIEASLGMKYKALLASLRSLNYEVCHRIGDELTNVFEKRFLGITETTDVDEEALTKPVNWVHILSITAYTSLYTVGLGSIDFYIDKMVYCCQRYCVPYFKHRTDLIIASRDVALGQFTGGLKRLDSCLEFFIRQNRISDIMDTIRTLIRVYREIGHYREVAALLDLSDRTLNAMVDKMHNAYDLQKAYQRMLRSIFEMYSGNFKDFYKNAEKARVTFETLGSTELGTYQEIFISLADRRLGRNRNAKGDMLSRIMMLKKRPSMAPKIFELLAMNIDYYVYRGDFDNVAMMLNVMQEESRTTRDRHITAKYFLYQAKYLSLTNQFEEAVKYISEAYAKFTEVDDISGMIECLCYLRMIVAFTDNYEVCEEFHTLLKYLIRKGNDTYMAHFVEIQRASIQLAIGKEIESALSTLESIYELSEKNNYGFYCVYICMSQVLHCSRNSDFSLLRKSYSRLCRLPSDLIRGMSLIFYPMFKPLLELIQSEGDMSEPGTHAMFNGFVRLSNEIAEIYEKYLPVEQLDVKSKLNIDFKQIEKLLAPTKQKMEKATEDDFKVNPLYEGIVV